MQDYTEDKVCRLVFAGDLLPADRDHTAGVGAGTKLERKQSLWSSKISDLFRQGDLSLINLEAPLVENTGENSRSAFAGQKGILDFLLDSGITHAHVANNHILEHGEKHFHKTVELLNQAGIGAVGVQENGKTRVNVQEINGATIAVAGFNAIHDIPDTENCYAALSAENVLSALCSPVMEKADIRILSFHWGNEYVHIPSLDQIRLARKAIDAGAHIVAGHHPHVVQPVESYKHGLICYSLGNFVFDMIWNRAVSTGLIVGITMGKDSVIQWDVYAARNHRHGPVTLLNNGWVNGCLKDYSQRMHRLLAQGETAYRRAYTKQVRFNRFTARIQMKVQLAFQLPSIPGKHRRAIVTSLIDRIMPPLKSRKR